MARQAPNVSRMRLLGAEVVGVDAGSKTLKDAINEAMRDWTENVATTHYVLGSALGPASVSVDRPRVPVGDRPRGARAVPQARRPRSARRRRVRGRRLQRDRPLLGVPRARASRSTASRPADAAAGPGEHAARFSGGVVGVLHGTRTMLLQDEAGQVLPTHSVSAGLDYPAVGPEHAALHDARPRDVREGLGRARRSTPSRSCARPRASSRRSSRRTRSPSRATLARRLPRSRLDPGQPLGPRRQGPRRVPAGARGEAAQ